MNSYINLGFINIYYYSICLFIAIIVGGHLILKESKRKQIPENLMVDLLFWTIIIGILGARLYFVIFNFDYYKYNLLEIFQIWHGGLAIHGGIIGALIFIYFYTKKNSMKIFEILDILVVGLIIAQAIGRWGNFFNGEAHGPECSLDFLLSLHLPSFIISGMYIDGSYYMPTFLFESIWCLIGFIILLLFRRRKGNKIGQVSGLYLIWYGVGRFFIEGLRTDSLMFFNLKMAQCVSVCMVIIGIIVIVLSLKSSDFYNKGVHNDD